MALVMGSPPAIIEPEILEDFGAPDIFAHGWTIGFGAEVITSRAYIEHVDRGVIRRQVVVRVHYPRTHWMAALGSTISGLPKLPGTH